MFLKIYKHSFLAPLKTLIPIFIIHFALAIVGGISIKITDSLQENVPIATLFGVISALSSVGITGLGIGEIVLVFASFRKAVATDEAYLTYTLPATTGQQLGARTLSIATWYVIITAISTVATFVYNAFSGKGLFLIDVMPSGEINAEIVWLIIEICIMAVVVIASVLLHVICGILLAQKFSTKTKTKSANAMTVLIGFAEGFALMVIFITLTVTLLSSGNMGVVNASPHVIIWAITVVAGALGGLCYFLSYRLMGRWLNLA